MATRKININLEEIVLNETPLYADGKNIIIMSENNEKERPEEEEEYVPHKKKNMEKIERHWTRPLTYKLIELVKMHYSRFSDKRFRRQAWIRIWKSLKPYATEMDLTVQQVERKWRSLHRMYKQTLELQQKMGKEKVKQSEYFEEIEEIVRKKPASQTLIVSDECVLPVSYRDSNPHTPPSSIHLGKSFEVEDGLNSSPIVTEITDSSNNDTQEPKVLKSPCKSVESALRELVDENRKAVYNEKKKIDVMAKDFELRKDFNEGVLSAINKRTEFLDRQQSMVLKVENMLLMTQRYDDKLDRLDNKIIKLENGMSKLENILEKYLHKLDKL